MNCHVEFAHAKLGSVNWVDVERSCSVASMVVDHLHSEGHTTTQGVLIDDKGVERDKRAQLADEFLSKLNGPSVSYFCFERDLSQYAVDLVALFVERRQRRVTDDIRRYFNKFHTLPCSVDIAIWHLLRLGLLADREHRLIWFAHPHHIVNVDFVASVLGDQLNDFERQARMSLLNYLSDTRARSRIFNIYYPETLSESYDALEFDALAPPELRSLLKGTVTCRQY